MDYIRLKKLNEDHDNVIMDEILDMSVKELLDKVEELDSIEDAEYEVIEAALIALKDKIIGDGYESDEINVTPDETVEKDDSEKIDPHKKEERDNFPTFNQATNDDNSDVKGSEGKEGLDNFNF